MTPERSSGKQEQNPKSQIPGLTENSSNDKVRAQKDVTAMHAFGRVKSVNVV